MKANRIYRSIRAIIGPVIFLFSCLSVPAQPNWDEIRSNVQFNIHDTTYDTPYLQACTNNGWEDGLYITRDGLHLYAFYFPGDFFKYRGNAIEPTVNCWNTLQNPNDSSLCCPNIVPFITADLVGMDTSITGFPCTSWLHSDIIHAERASPADPFGPWMPMHISDEFWLDGGFAGVLEDGAFDIVMYTRTTDYANDIFMIKNTGFNPELPEQKLNISVHGVAEDNPHVEKIDDYTYVLVYDNHSGNPTGEVYYSFSFDSGYTWEPPLPLTSVNSFSDVVIQPHLWKDPDDNTWWLYFTSALNNKGAIYRSRLDGSLTPEAFNTFGEIELVLSPGEIALPDVEFIGVGEPSLTEHGDLSFVAAYRDLANETDYLANQIDPWFMPKKNPTSTLEASDDAAMDITIYPNPGNGFIYIEIEGHEQGNKAISIYDIYGREIMEPVQYKPHLKLDLTGFYSGMYFLVVRQDHSRVSKKFVVK